jgi:hypothetical protein
VGHRLDGTPHHASAEDDRANSHTSGNARGRITRNASDGRGNIRGRSHGGEDGSSEHSASGDQFVFHVVVVVVDFRETARPVYRRATQPAEKFTRLQP